MIFDGVTVSPFENVAAALETIELVEESGVMLGFFTSPLGIVLSLRGGVIVGRGPRNRNIQVINEKLSQSARLTYPQVPLRTNLARSPDNRGSTLNHIYLVLVP